VEGAAGTHDAEESMLCLIVAQAENVHDMNLAVMKNIVRSSCTPLIVTVNKPQKVLVKMYGKEGIPPESYYVVDAVTQYSGGECPPSPRIRYVNNPANLTDLGIAITETLKKMPAGKKCILFDSVSMLLIHMPSATTSKFLHFVVNKLKLDDIHGIFLSVEKGLDPVVMSQMSAFVDRVMDYDDVVKKPCLL
jgi:hypothetical protein